MDDLATALPIANHPSRPTVGVIIQPSLAHSRAVLAGISAYARDRRHTWSLRLLVNREQVESSFAELAGIIGFLNDDLAAFIDRQGVPAVNFSSSISHPAIPDIHSDERGIGRLAAEHLLEKGFRQFAVAGLWHTSFSKDRILGFQEALQAADLHEPPLHIDTHRNDQSHDQQHRDMIDWLRDLPEATGIFCVTDWIAQQVLQIAAAQGRAIPESLAILGVDNEIMICEFADPPLSSVQQATDRIGYEACEILASRLAGHPAPSAPRLIPPRSIVARRSTDILAVSDPEVAKAIAIIHAQPNGQLKLSDLFAQIPLSRRMLELRFKAALGRTIQQEIWRKQIEHLRYLLEETDLPFKKIAETTGFAYLSYFNTFFKKQTGLTPSQCRQQARRYTRT